MACADLCHVPLDELYHYGDANDTLVASISVAEAMASGRVVTTEPRQSSPNGLAWPGITPAWRPPRQREACQVCGPRGCRR